MSAEKCILNKREWLLEIIFTSCHSEESTSTQACPGKPAIGARRGPEAAGPWLGSCPHLGQVSLSWALALEGLQRRGDAVARHQLLGDTLFLLAWPPPRGPGLLWSSSCLLQPLTRPQSQSRGQVRVGPAAVGPQEGRAHFPQQDPEAS